MREGPIDIGPCFHCKEPMWMSAAAYETYRRNCQTFYCVHGHKQQFVKGKSDLTLAQEALAAERQARQRAEQRVAQWQDDAREARAQAEREKRRANGYKGHAAKISKRAKAGVCPCCNRTFSQLARHMASQHPQFTPLDAQPEPQGETVQ